MANVTFDSSVASAFLRKDEIAQVKTAAEAAKKEFIMSATASVRLTLHI